MHIPANVLYELTVTTVNGNEGVNGLIFPALAKVGDQSVWFREYAAPGHPIRT